MQSAYCKNWIFRYLNCGTVQNAAYPCRLKGHQHFILIQDFTSAFYDNQFLKHFTDDNLTDTELMEFVSKMKENIVEKGENAGDQHFLLFPQCFQ